METYCKTSCPRGDNCPRNGVTEKGLTYSCRQAIDVVTNKERCCYTEYSYTEENGHKKCKLEKKEWLD